MIILVIKERDKKMTKEDEIRICLNCTVSQSLCTGDANSPRCELYRRKAASGNEKPATRYKRIAAEMGFGKPCDAAGEIFRQSGSGENVIDVFGCSVDTARYWIRQSGLRPKRIDWGKYSRSFQKKK